jgi:hypothetical protein
LFHENFLFCESLREKFSFSQKFSWKFFVNTKVFVFKTNFRFCESLRKFFFAKRKIFAKFFVSGLIVSFLQQVTMKILQFNFNFSALSMATLSVVLTIQLGASGIKRLSHLFRNRTRIC